MSQISSSIKRIEEELKKHASNAERIRDLDKRLDIHLEDYVNYKDATLLAINGNKERIEHKAEKTEEQFREVRIDIKEIQNFLHKQQNFIIRE
ncbi:hypothetical protein JYQ62_14045 [Nostoc sp. UHCC 0702]|nr:hypothetical protein JYQ62_14045 [Nostoc sp. UHCC 0702]